MPDLRFPWLHGTGWTLLVLGGTLWALTIIVIPPHRQRRWLLWVFGLIAVAGLACLGVYFGMNAGYVPLDRVGQDIPLPLPSTALAVLALGGGGRCGAALRHSG